MTHDDFIRIERVANRAFNAAKQFADKDDAAALNRAAFILAEVRFAAEYVCNPDQYHAEDAIKRLAELFTRDF